MSSYVVSFAALFSPFVLCVQSLFRPRLLDFDLSPLMKCKHLYQSSLSNLQALTSHRYWHELSITLRRAWGSIILINGSSQPYTKTLFCVPFKVRAYNVPGQPRARHVSFSVLRKVSGGPRCIRRRRMNLEGQEQSFCTVIPNRRQNQFLRVLLPAYS